MNIGELSARSGLGAHALRYYERLGLLRPGRSGGNYRDYGEADLRRLAFIARAKQAGFPLKRIAGLIDRIFGEGMSLGDVRALLLEQRREVEGRIRELEGFRDELDGLLSCRETAAGIAESL